MKYLGIDFGSKRVGIAVSDDLGKLAFPYAVLQNDKKMLETILEILKKEEIRKIVLGESKNFQGMPNKIQNEIDAFKEELEEKTRLKVESEPEFMTSVQAEQITGKNEMHDASAAAIILQSFLDKNNL
jgi:putative holliday junction resolvase